ncbi:MAG: DUF2007 domain-containing protein [Bacteroidetes bacterium]|nr:DUF2007 domain-containing protein [Bacteroidota bacterium]MBS1974401.1 DUF2007 domain-containing protein [Bacteroidota bacterium]
MKFIELCSFDNYVNAHIVLGMLQEAGINCHLKDEYTVTIDPLLSPALGGMKIMVCDVHYARAVELVGEMNKKE